MSTTTRDQRVTLIAANLRAAIVRRLHRIDPAAPDVPDPTVALARLGAAFDQYAAATAHHLETCRYARAELIPGALADHLEVALAAELQELRGAMIDEIGQPATDHLLALVVPEPEPEPEPDPDPEPEPRPGWLARVVRALRDLAR